ncbi:thioredoxin domain-containing protein [Maribacter arenosus]|uniref:Thioredoxin domain-containing protein n=2 Tax=Maribacter arenosus TaxID=1854708 RepID=A0ABR7V8Q3_9FLAO|nr:thioredoxin domain-containing protein [Maribacter arenosus]
MVRKLKLKKYSYILTLFLIVLFMSCQQNTAQNEEYPFTNDLINETSPYLLQHAHNPVNWRPWNDDVFEEATKDDKLVIISIGYSSCHWCHVMEEETFEDEKVAEIMNRDFISIKVDREERPDVDQVYMTAVQLMTGNGGWPLNVIVLPNGKPMYGGTYHTNEQWTSVLQKIHQLYKDNPQKANEYAEKVAQGIKDVNLIVPTEKTNDLSVTAINEGLSKWKSDWDLEWGGNVGREKFMLPGQLEFLLDEATIANDSTSLSFVKTTLDQMARGGIYDHVAGGFYRYSTDPKWHIPHFEKMLYDNAQLASLYAKAYTIFKKPAYKKISMETLAFLKKEMKNVDGGYFAAIDADSEGEEGKYYVWTEEELEHIIQKDYSLFKKYYSIDSSKKMEGGKIVLYQSLEDETFIKEHQTTQKHLGDLKASWRANLLEVRKNRVKPNIDDKIIVSWNALLINGYVDAYKAFGTDEYLNEAKSIYNAIIESAYLDDQLIHSYKKGSKRSKGFLEDYVFMANASINLYTASMDPRHLEFAQKLIKTTLIQFKDDSSDFYRFTADESLIAKIIKNDDGVIPSPNAVLANSLFLLGHIEYNRDYMANAKAMLLAMQPYLKDGIRSYTHWASLQLKMTYPYYEIAVVGDKAYVLRKELQQKFLANTLIVASTQESNLPLFKGRYVSDGTYIYVCKDNTCKLPVENIEDALEQLHGF